MNRLIALLTICLCFTGKTSAQFKMLMLRNCQGERRTATMHPQVNMIWKCTAHWTTLRDQRIFRFAPTYQLDSTWFNSQIQEIRKRLPANFFTINLVGDWFDNVPDQPAIWFTLCFAHIDPKGSIKVYAAVKVDFTGTNAHEDSQRRDAQITGLTFIFDPKELKALGLQLQHSPQPQP